MGKEQIDFIIGITFYLLEFGAGRGQHFLDESAKGTLLRHYASNISLDLSASSGVLAPHADEEKYTRKLELFITSLLLSCDIV